MAIFNSYVKLPEGTIGLTTYYDFTRPRYHLFRKWGLATKCVDACMYLLICLFTSYTCEPIKIFSVSLSLSFSLCLYIYIYNMRLNVPSGKLTICY